MDQIIDIPTIVQREVEAYAAAGWQMTDYRVSDKERQVFTVIGIPDYPRDQHVSVVVMARVEGEYVIIEEDITDRPLVKELVRAGIPRERIILTYIGEQLPQPVS
jgi:hypothetical protein